MIYENDLEEKQNFEVRQYREGEFFAEEEFFTGSSYHCTVRSNNFCVIQRLERRTFLDLIENNARDFEIFSQMKDQIMFLQTESPFRNKECSICKKENHPERYCPNVHLNFNELRIRERYAYENVIRYRTKRARNKKRWRFWDSFWDHQLSAEEFLRNEEEEIYRYLIDYLPHYLLEEEDGVQNLIHTESQNPISETPVLKHKKTLSMNYFPQQAASQ